MDTLHDRDPKGEILTPIGSGREIPVPINDGRENTKKGNEVKVISGGIVLMDLPGPPSGSEVRTGKTVVNPKNICLSSYGSSIIKQEKIINVSTVERSKKLPDYSEDHLIIITSKHPIKITLPSPVGKSASSLTIKGLYADVPHTILGPSGIRIKNNSSFNLSGGSCKKFVYTEGRYQVL